MDVMAENDKDENLGASTSKNENNSKDEDDLDDRGPTRRHSSVSSHSVDSYVSSRGEYRKNEALERGTLSMPRRKKRVRRGRVMKVRRTGKRRCQPVRRAADKPRPQRVNKRDRDSVSTILTRLSSDPCSERVLQVCSNCGHRCCGRRYIEKKEKKAYPREVAKIRKYRKQPKEVKMKKRKRPNFMGKMKTKNTVCGRKRKRKCKDKIRIKIYKSACIQAGSQSKVLSPLIVKSGANEPSDDVPSNKSNYQEITPTMIYEALEHLSKWRHIVPFAQILGYIKVNYPVNRNEEELTDELLSKLTVAAIVGIVKEVMHNNVPHWWLTDDLQKRGITENHVTIFWKVYSDTMSPIQKRRLLVQMPPPPRDKIRSPSRYLMDPDEDEIV